jgi:hypothetical protein
MKKILFLSLFVMAFGLLVNTALAGGDQNTGSIGRGETVEHHNQEDCGSFWFCPDSDK